MTKLRQLALTSVVLAALCPTWPVCAGEAAATDLAEPAVEQTRPGESAQPPANAGSANNAASQRRPVINWLWAPDAPSNLVATAASSSQINLSWTENANNEDGLYIERKIGADGTYSRIVSAGANTASYQDNGLSAGTTYYYRVCAYNPKGNSPYSNEASATTPSGGSTVLPPQPMPTEPKDVEAMVVDGLESLLSNLDVSGRPLIPEIVALEGTIELTPERGDTRSAAASLRELGSLWEDKQDGQWQHLVDYMVRLTDEHPELLDYVGNWHWDISINLQNWIVDEQKWAECLHGMEETMKADRDNPVFMCAKLRKTLDDFIRANLFSRYYGKALALSERLSDAQGVFEARHLLRGASDSVQGEAQKDE